MPLCNLILSTHTAPEDYERMRMTQASTIQDTGRRSRPIFGDRRRRRHEQAVIQTEVRRLANAVRPFGVLKSARRAHRAAPSAWRG